MNMKGRNLLITGATGSIGKAIVFKLAEKFDNIFVHYCNSGEMAKELESYILSKKSNAYLIKADLSSNDGIKSLIEQVRSRVDEIDVLINNVGGVVIAKDFTEYNEFDFYKIFNLNFFASFRLCQEFFPEMCKKQYGRIVNISSIGVKFGGGSQTFLYSAAKCSLEQITVNLSKLGAEKNVLVNTVRIGVIDTKFHEKITNKAMERRIQMIPMKRFGESEDIANMVDYLTSDKANFITGQTFAVSGGE
jgi:3-oxoacyl-[acyl-carrier protein] reductase